MNDDELLTIVCPRQMLAQPIMLSCVLVPFLSFILAKAWEALPAARAWPPFVVGLAMLAVVLGILYRNLVFRDRLYIARDKHAWQAPAPYSVDEIVAIRLLPPPEWYGFEGKNAAIGLGQGRIEIETTTERIRFGLGLNEYALVSTMDRIAAFCGLDTRPGASFSAGRTRKP